MLLFLLCLHHLLCSCNVFCSHDAEHVSSAVTSHVTANTVHALRLLPKRTESLIFLVTASALPGFQVPNHWCCGNRISVIHLCTIFFLSIPWNVASMAQTKYKIPKSSKILLWLYWWFCSQQHKNPQNKSACPNEQNRREWLPSQRRTEGSRHKE